MSQPVVLTVNDVTYPLAIEPERTLLSVLRTDVGLTGPKEGCDDSECGACMVLLDGVPVNACSYLAAQAEGRAIVTVEGLAPAGGLSELQESFLAEGAAQCGFCTPGMLISATALLEREPSPDREAIGVALAGNLCRCTGYAKIVRAVERAAEARTEAAAADGS